MPETLYLSPEEEDALERFWERRSNQTPEEREAEDKRLLAENPEQSLDIADRLTAPPSPLRSAP